MDGGQQHHDYAHRCVEYILFLARLVVNGEFGQVRYRVTRLAKHYLLPKPHLPLIKCANYTAMSQNEIWILNDFEPGNRIAITIHAYYPDIALNELAPLVNTRLSHEVDVFISVPSSTDASTQKALSNAFHGRVCIIPLFNKGRDILPFLTVLPKLIENKYDWVCKIHTKRSKHTRHGERWRQDLYTILLSEQSIRAIHNMTPKQGLAYPWFSLCSIKNFVDGNRERLDELVLTHACENSIAGSSFIAGSMFWFRPEGLAALTSVSLDYYRNNFEPELGQIDSTYAHAMERLFLHIIFEEGFSSYRLK